MNIKGYRVRWDCKNHNHTTYLISESKDNVVEFIESKTNFEKITEFEEIECTFNKVEELGYSSWRKGFFQ